MSANKLVEYLNLCAEYARLPESFVFSGIQKEPGQAQIEVEGERYLVDVRWAMGNAKRLPDRTTKTQMIKALVLSHPSNRQVLNPHP